MLVPVARLAPCGLAELTATGVITVANDTLLNWLDLPRDEVIGHEVFEFVKDDQNTLKAALQSDEWDGTPFSLEAQLRAGQSSRPVLLASSSYDVDGERRMSIVFFDATASTGVSERATSDRDLARRVTARLQVLVETAASFGRSTSESELGQHLVDAILKATGADDVAAYLLRDDQTFAQLAGTNPLLGRYPRGARSAAIEALRTGQPIIISSPEEADDFAPDWNLGQIFREAGVHAILVAPIVDQDQIGGITAFFRNPISTDDQLVPLTGALAGQAAQVFVRLRLEDDRRRAANRDVITGLANRRLLEERSAAIVSAPETMVAALFLDLDGFKRVNDERGHAVGDHLLGEVGRRISSIIREEDAVARYGGDEFVAICTVPDEATAIGIAERVRESIAQPYDGVIADVVVRASVGVAIAKSPTSIENLIRAADVAMYEAKGAGGDVVRINTAA